MSYQVFSTEKRGGIGDMAEMIQREKNKLDNWCCRYTALIAHFWGDCKVRSESEYNVCHIREGTRWELHLESLCYFNANGILNEPLPKKDYRNNCFGEILKLVPVLSLQTIVESANFISGTCSPPHRCESENLFSCFNKVLHSILIPLFDTLPKESDSDLFDNVLKEE